MKPSHTDALKGINSSENHHPIINNTLMDIFTSYSGLLHQESIGLYLILVEEGKTHRGKKMLKIIRLLTASRSGGWDWLIRGLWFGFLYPAVCVCVCMCSYVSSWQDVGPRSLAVPLAAHGEALLICWSNRCQNTPGAVTLEGQEERRQCVLYTVVHRMSAAWHLLITAATFMWGNQDLPQSWFIRQTRWSRASVFTSVFLGEVASDDI